jgi:RNA polymerase sigma-70 factor, ECF subfamily
MSRMEPDDKALIAEVIGGNADAFEALIVRYQGRVFASARRHVASESDAQDVVQEVFCKAYAKLPTYRGEAPFEHWLMRLAVRTCYDYLRSRKRRPEILFSEMSEAESAWLQSCHAETDAREIDAAGARELVHRLLDQLPAPYRLVITLLEIEEKTVKEIAQLTGWSVPLVKVRAFRARRMMRHLLERITRAELNVTRPT